MLVLFIFFLFEILLVCEIQKFGKALYVGQFQTKIYYHSVLFNETMSLRPVARKSPSRNQWEIHKSGDKFQTVDSFSFLHKNKCRPSSDSVILECPLCTGTGRSVLWEILKKLERFLYPQRSFFFFFFENKAYNVVCFHFNVSYTSRILCLFSQ